MLSHSIKRISLKPWWFIFKELLAIKSNYFNFNGNSQNYSVIDNLCNTNDSVFDSFCINSTIFDLQNQGFFLGINLPQDVVKEIWNLAMQKHFYGNQETAIGFHYADKEPAEASQQKPLTRGIYDQSALVHPAIKKLERDPKLREIATQYLKAEPVHLESKLWWNFALDSTLYERRRAAQRFHYDVNNSRCLKFLFYLTDVDLCSSPHVCIQGSHVKKRLVHRLFKKECSSQEITDYYGYENIIPICGKAGFGFVEDGRCFYKSTSPSSTDRLTLEIKFAAKH